MDEFHDAPTLSGADMTKHSGVRYPQDMIYTARVWQDYLTRFAPQLGNLEVWNETDDKYGPACGYVPMLKAIAYAKQQAGVATPLSGGIFSQLASDGFREDQAQNRMLEVADAISYHNYADPSVIEATVKWYRDYLARHGRESLPIYITESGWPWTGEAAKNIVMKAVEAKACGIQQNYPFFAQNYHEGALDFSLLHDNLTPKLALAAYCRLAALLSKHQYVGDLKLKDILRARVFSNGEDYVAVLYPSGTGSSIKIPDFPIDRMEGIDGRNIPVTKGKVIINDGLMYWFLNPQTVKAHFSRYINSDTEAMKLYRRSQLPLVPSKPSSLVLLPKVKTEQLVCQQARPSGYFVATAAEKQFELAVDVFNLSDAPQTVSLQLEVPKGIVVSTDSPVQITIPSQAKSTVKWKFDTSKFFTSNRGFQTKITAIDSVGAVLDYASVPLFSAIQDRKIYNVQHWNGKSPALPDSQAWNAVTPIIMSRNGNLAQDDFGVDARFLWSTQGLYFRFIVKDIVHAQECDEFGSWRQDSIQLAFDPMNSMRNDGTQYEYGISMRGNKGPARWFCWIKGGKKQDSMSPDSRLYIRRDEARKQTIYHGVIAPEDITPFVFGAKKEIGFDFCVNNSNGAQEREALEWTPGIETGCKDSSLFGLLRLQQ